MWEQHGVAVHEHALAGSAPAAAPAAAAAGLAAAAAAAVRRAVAPPAASRGREACEGAWEFLQVFRSVSKRLKAFEGGLRGV